MAHTLPQGDEGRPRRAQLGAVAYLQELSPSPRLLCGACGGQVEGGEALCGPAALYRYERRAPKRRASCVWCAHGCARECMRGVAAFRKRGQCAQGLLCAPNEYVALPSPLPRSEGAIRWYTWLVTVRASYPASLVKPPACFVPCLVVGRRVAFYGRGGRASRASSQSAHR